MESECEGDARAAFCGGADAVERRSGLDRRRLTVWSLVRGGLTPRRRGGRRHGEHETALVDWHEPHLLFLSVAILVLSVGDAFMTLTLLMHGAEEANPLLAYVLRHHPNAFAIFKMALTGGAVVVLVALARARVFSRIRAGVILHWCLVGYVVLIGYELWLFRQVL